MAGEAIASVAGPVRIVCNSDLDPQDLITAAAAQAALRRSWCSGKPEEAPPAALPRYRALYAALTSKKVEVRVLPDSAFGLIHGKAGVVRRADGSATAFLGSVNESASAWKLNYELLWEDSDPQTIAWVQEEFDALWNDARAVDLACCPFIAQDVRRIIARKVIEPADIKAIADPTGAAAAAAVETPVYRREQGLWPHQKYFAHLALERHRLGGARLVLADQVGLGKTVQLAMAALLMALDEPDGGPILVLAPKPLLQQWQDELMELLLLPSARWNGRAWVDENDLEYPSEGAKSLGKCPRRIGLVSQGLVAVSYTHLDTFSILADASENNVGLLGKLTQADARDLRETCDLWITDPPYADAVNYHELGDFFLAWYDKQLARAFPEWTPDARAELAVRGDGEDFRRSMVEIYRKLARHMPDNGLQMVMFTHQNPAVWADLGMILWAAGLKATAAWTISTETEAAGIKKGNYVQGTVCLVLRKRIASEPGFLDEVYPMVEDEVKRQIASMLALDEDGEPNFNDADYQLAAYAAALKVLTQYGNLDGKDVEHEVFAVRARNEKSDFQTVIERALGIACDTLVPRGLDTSWRELSLVERYYLRALDIESRGERRKGMYEELARGFGVTDIRPLLKSDKANGTRMFTPAGLAASLLAPVLGAESNHAALPARRGRVGAGAPHPFAVSPLRHLMFAIRETAAADNSPEPGRQYLRDTFGQGYWGKREGFVALLEWLAALAHAEGMNEWTADSEAARILAGRLRNDHA